MLCGAAVMLPSCRLLWRPHTRRLGCLILNLTRPIRPSPSSLSAAPSQIPLHPADNKTGEVWHIALPNLDPTLLYGYRVFGAHEQEHEDSEGQRHDPVRRAARGR